MSGAEDPRLLRASALGDREAFDSFVARHEGAVFRFLRASAMSEADAEDALQETFVSAWTSAGTFRGDGSARGWIVTIARNALRRSARRRSGEPSAFVNIEDLGLAAGWGSDEEPLEELARRDLLTRALDAIPQEDRQVLVLRELEGFCGDEVAELLGITLAAMKSRLHRARLRFVVALREVGYE